MNNGTRRYGVTYFTTQPQYTLPSGDSTAVLYLIATHSTASILNRGSTGSVHTATEQLYLTDCLIDSPSASAAAHAAALRQSAAAHYSSCTLYTAQLRTPIQVPVRRLTSTIHLLAAS